MTTVKKVDELKELRNAVFATQPNYILKQVIRDLNHKNAYYGESNAAKLIKLLQINPATCVPIYFNEMTYKKKEHEKNFFLFLDEEFRLMGILKGNTHKEEFNEIERYSSGNDFAFSFSVIKNRKNLTAKATHILMITPEMRSIKEKKYKPLGKTNHKRELEYRLKQYKIDKYKNMDDVEVQRIIESSLMVCTKNLFNPIKRAELVVKLNKVFGWHRSEDELHGHIADISQLAHTYQRTKINNDEYLKRRGLVSNDQDEHNEFNWHFGELNGAKVKISQIKKALEGEI